MTAIKVAKATVNAGNVAVLIKAFDGKLSESRNVRNALIAREGLIENFKRGLAKSLSDSTGVQQSDISTIFKLAKGLTPAQRKSVTSLTLPTSVDDTVAVAAFVAKGAKFFTPGSRAAGAKAERKTADKPSTVGEGFDDMLAALIAEFDSGSDEQRAAWSAMIADAFTPEAVESRTVAEVAA